MNGIEIEVGSNLVSFGTFLLSWHGFFSFIAVATAVFMVGRWAPMKGIDPDVIYSIAIWAIIGGVIGARVVHVIDQWQAVYQHNPIQVLFIWTGGIGLWGGILGGFLGGTAYALWAKHPVGVIADLTAPVMLLSQSIGRLGDIVNGEHCAKAANDFIFAFNWVHPQSDAAACARINGTGIGVPVQPVVGYEILWNLAAMFVVWKLRNKIRPDGMLFALYLALYALGRFGISFLRDDRIWALGMQEAHYIALLVLVITVPLLIIKARPALGQMLATDDGLGTPPPTRQRGTRAERRRRMRR